MLQQGNGESGSRDNLCGVSGSPRQAFLLCRELARENLQPGDFQIEKRELLGAGGFGSVYLGAFAKRTVAIKVLNKKNNNQSAQDESYKAELRLLALNHEHIVKSLAATAAALTDQYESSVVIMEYVPGRNLNDLINNPGEELPIKRRVKFARLLSYALDYAHENNIVHMDVKPANIMVTLDDSIKLGDFGCCQLVEADTGTVSPTQRSILTGTIAYRAPEVLRGDPPTFKADVYSVGITLWQMLSRQPPHGNVNHPHVIVFGVVAYNLRPEPVDVQGDFLDMHYTDVYTECWSASPDDRPSISSLAELFEIWQKYL